MTKSLLTGLLVLAVAATTAAADDPPPHKVTTKRDGDKVGVRTEKDKVTSSVRSPFGIGQAVIERAGEAWPDAVTLRLHLTGLGNFKVTSGKTTLEGSVSLQDGKPVVRLWKGGQEDAPLDAQSPYWMKIGASRRRRSRSRAATSSCRCPRHSSRVTRRRSRWTGSTSTAIEA